MQNPRSLALPHARSSSLAFVPPRPLPPIPPASRSSLNDAATLTQGLGIFKALDPFATLDAPADNESKTHKRNPGHHIDKALGEERIENKIFWTVTDMDKQKESGKGKERKDEEGLAELTRAIGFLTATASEDWSLVLEVCDRASASEANAKEAVEALRREFEYAEPMAQMGAARLWAIMLQNSSEIFMQQIMSCEFLDTLEDVLTSSKTSPVVREWFLDVLAAVVYTSQNENKDGQNDEDGFRGLWRRLRPANKPEEGVPFDIDDAMFNPPMPRPTSEYLLETQAYHNQPYQLQPNLSSTLDLREPLVKPPRQRIILQQGVPFEIEDSTFRPPTLRPTSEGLLEPQVDSDRSYQHQPNLSPTLDLQDLPDNLPEQGLVLPEKDIRRLFQECKVGLGDARLLAEMLVSVKPEDLQKEVIQELHQKCRASQELLYAEIPGASAAAQRSLLAKGPRYQLTVEEELLATLLNLNDRLLEVLLAYDDLEEPGLKESEKIDQWDVGTGRMEVPSGIDVQTPESTKTNIQVERSKTQAREQRSSLAKMGQATYGDSVSIHSAVLPTLNINLHDALVTDLPLCNIPLDYIHADATHVNNVVQELLILTQRKELNHTRFAGRMIYQRLIVYNFTHLMFCTSHESLLNEFEETLQHWRSWDDITVIQNHQLIKDHLLDLFKRGLNAQSNPTSHSEEVFHQLAALDIVGLSAQLTDMVTDNSTYKKVLTQRGPAAQSLLNLLQARLEFPMDRRHNHRLVKALILLSRASGLYPECLVLKSIEMEMHPVDRGSYGDVYKGVLHGQKIAVKALRIYQTSNLVKLLKEFSSEAVIWRQLSHPNVLPFYGVYHLDETTRRLCLTAPWMENGNVVEFLTQYPGTYCIHLMLDVAQGLEHLHSLAPSIIHGDLKGVNVLITQSGRACLADFGLARVAMNSKTISVNHSLAGKAGGTMRWQAPELLSTDIEGSESYQYCSSKASDIYAFACVCYEMFSGEVPFFDNPHDIRVILGVMQGKRPTRPLHNLSTIRGFSDEVWGLIEACWAQDPAQRPTAKWVVEQIQLLNWWQVDQRPFDEFRFYFPSQALYKHTEHPFSTLATTGQAVLAW